MPTQGFQEPKQQEGQPQGTQGCQGLQVLVVAVEAVIESGLKLLLMVGLEKFFLKIPGPCSQQGGTLVGIQGMFPFLDPKGPPPPSVALVGSLGVDHFAEAGLVDGIGLDQEEGKEYRPKESR